MPHKLDKVAMDLPPVTQVLEESKQVLRECFKRFQLDEVFLSFNGGKDCTVLLDITLNVLQEVYDKTQLAKDFKVVYIRTKGPFREIEDFVKETDKHYGIKLQITEGDLKETLQRLLKQDGRLKACLMGTRRTDPYSENLEHFQKTDPSWPSIMRVSPLLNWSYHHVWSYILRRKVPYCSLYDKGYTSIGGTKNTSPNPSLAYKNNCGCLAYFPAWHLCDGSLERAGRVTNAYLTSNSHETRDNDTICLCSKSHFNGEVLEQ